MCDFCVFGPSFLMQYLVSLLFLQHSFLLRIGELSAFLLLSSCCLVAVYGDMGWFTVCAYGTCISWSESLFSHFIYIAIKIDQLFYVSLA